MEFHDRFNKKRRKQFIVRLSSDACHGAKLGQAFQPGAPKVRLESLTYARFFALTCVHPWRVLELRAPRDLWPLAAETAKEPTSRSLALVPEPPAARHNLNKRAAAAE
jgi:hypothetical protein